MSGSSPARWVPFNRPFEVGTELTYIHDAFARAHLSGDGPFTERCHEWLAGWSGSRACLLTPSCTAALEMAALLAEVGPGDEVIMPSYTFVSTANAFALRGAVPVFVDVRDDTLNIDESRVADAITPRTRAIVCVHYGGVASEMDALTEIARGSDLLVVEDAAQALLATYRGRPLGSIGDLAAFSFHETKNVTCGEGGSLHVNAAEFEERAYVLREKGTNRRDFTRGQVDKYTWIDIGSSFLLGEASAAMLWAQLERATEITARRVAVWDAYHQRFADLEEAGLARRPVIPAHCGHNGHVYRLRLAEPRWRGPVLERVRREGVDAVFHYVPLHSSAAGRRLGRTAGPLGVTDAAGADLLRVPLWAAMPEDDVDYVVEVMERALRDVAAGG